MSRTAAIRDEVGRVGAAIADQAVQSLPSLAGAVLLLLVGWVAAKLSRALITRLVLVLDLAASRTFGAPTGNRMKLAGSANVLGGLVFWAVLLVFVAAAAHVLGLPLVTRLLAGLLDYLPALIAGLIIGVGGFLISRVVADFIRRAPGPLASGQREVAARAAQITIVVAALLVAAEQLGVRITFLAIIAGVAAIAVVGGLMVAISLGARTHVANLIGAQQVRQRCQIGQRIRIAGFEGRILDLSAQGVVLETADGRVVVPGRLFSEQIVELLERGADD